MITIINVILWTVFVTVVSQTIAITVMAGLGLMPRRLRYEIEDRQNPAIGAFFFVISLIAAIYIGFASGDGYQPADSVVEDILWVAGGGILALILTAIIFWAAHILLQPIEGENVLGYMRRELVEEQNAALAFFLGGLAIAPFVAAINQIL
jgi:hypothetical protein